MTNNKIYHIYAKNKCLVHSISEDEFETVWKTLHKMLEILPTDYTQNDLSYEELTVNQDIVVNSSY